MAIAPIERRKIERVGLDLPVRFRLQNRTIEGRIADISNGGMCIITADVLGVEDQGFFEIFDIGSGMKLHVEGQVVWSQPRSRIKQRRHKRPGKMGIKFVLSRFLKADAIESFVGQIASAKAVS